MFRVEVTPTELPTANTVSFYRQVTPTEFYIHAP